MAFKGVFKGLMQKVDGGGEGMEQVSEFDEQLKQLSTESRKEERWGWVHVPLTECPTYKELKELDPKKKVRLIFQVTQRLVSICHILSKKKSYSSADEDYLLGYTYDALLFNLLRMKLEFGEDEIISLFKFLHDNSGSDPQLRFENWPIGLIVVQFEKYVKWNGLTDSMRDFIKKALSWPEFNQSPSYYRADIYKAQLKLWKLIHSTETEGNTVPPYRLPEDDVLGKYVNDSVDQLSGEFKERLYEMFNLALTATGAQPSEKHIKASKEILSRMNTTQYKTCVQDWLNFLTVSSPIQKVHKYTYQDQEYTYTSYTFICEKNSILVKGLIWSLYHFHDEATMNIVSKLTERSFKKIPGVGPTCAGVGNACIYYLANSKGISGISHLSRLKLKITQNSTRKLIDEYIHEESNKRGVSAAELEEQAVPDFSLDTGVREEKFDDYVIRLSLTGIGKTELQWFTPEGKPQKSTPAFIKNNKRHSERLHKLRHTAKQIQKYLTAQRDRIDRSYIDDRQWAYADFCKYYLNHGLVSFIARHLIWILITNGSNVSAIWRGGQWEDVNGNVVSGIGETTKVLLWHPLLTTLDEVMQWRYRFDALQIQQPMKQAYREVYILTEAELETRSYSNRMAAHILKQHQFNALAGLRGWKYSLLGSYDDGREGETARIKLPAHKIVAEYWINEIYSEDAFNDAGIWDYVSTDQVRFVDESGEAINLIDIPKIVFSEIMRDVDLFVGVASVGNDPEWLDRGGITEYREYWVTYSFGDLTEIAKTRKAALEQLLPRLVIRDKVTIDGKFVRVKGKLREYKIHIGSTNILMEPNDQYLCIVPARAKEKPADKVFLPFEGDRGLSLIPSKAVLLADDDKIEDETILNQIHN